MPEVFAPVGLPKNITPPLCACLPTKAGEALRLIKKYFPT